MSADERAASAGDDALFGVEDQALNAGRMGATEAAVRRSLTAAALDERDKGGAELAAQLARAVDVAQTVRHDPYGVATAGRELREQLTRLRLDPVARLGNDAGAVQAWLGKLTEAD